MRILQKELVLVNGYSFRGNNSACFILTPLLNGGSGFKEKKCSSRTKFFPLTLLYSEKPKLYAILASLSGVGLRVYLSLEGFCYLGKQRGSHNICLPFKKWQKNMEVYTYTRNYWRKLLIFEKFNYIYHFHVLISLSILIISEPTILYGQVSCHTLHHNQYIFGSGL